MYITNTYLSSKSAFSIIEVIIGIFIFTLWLVAVYALMISSLALSEYNKNAIIASQLAVEQIEIVRNIRDTNYKTVGGWNIISGNERFTPWHYTVENDFSGWWNIKIFEIRNFQEWQEFMTEMESYKLCKNNNNVYTYDCSWWNRKTPYYRYLHIESDPNNDNILKLTSKVIWYSRWYHEYDIKTLITDWRRL